MPNNSNHPNQGTGTGAATRDKVRIEEPRQYKVIFHNDDFTTMEFVVRLLKVVFFKSEAEAQTIMLTVHHSDKGLVGVYSYDVAVSKVRLGTQMARDEGFPLRLSYNPE